MISITFSCLKCRNSLISRSVRFASTTFSNAFTIFLIATFLFVSNSLALHTTPYAPFPIGFMGAYLASTSNTVPHTANLDVTAAVPRPDRPSLSRRAFRRFALAARTTSSPPPFSSPPSTPRRRRRRRRRSLAFASRVPSPASDSLSSVVVSVRDALSDPVHCESSSSVVLMYARASSSSPSSSSRIRVAPSAIASS